LSYWNAAPSGTLQESIETAASTCFIMPTFAEAKQISAEDLAQALLAAVIWP